MLAVRRNRHVRLCVYARYGNIRPNLCPFCEYLPYRLVQIPLESGRSHILYSPVRLRPFLFRGFYLDTMDARFSKRELIPKPLCCAQYGDTAVLEFEWDFYATAREDGSAVHMRDGNRRS